MAGARLVPLNDGAMHYTCWLFGCLLACVLPSPQEHLVYPHAVSALVDGRVTWREDGIPVLWEAH